MFEIIETEVLKFIVNQHRWSVSIGGLMDLRALFLLD